MKIEMVDVVGQYLNMKEEIDGKILDVVASGIYIGGPEVSAFNSELAAYVGVKHCIACGNGTDALQIAMMALDLQPGDEVITTSFTYVATAEVIALLRLKPVLVECNPDTFTIDPNAVRKAISNKTKAIVPVHLYGQCADMDAILEIAKEYNLKVIEDAAQSISSVYTNRSGISAKSGAMGHIGCTSFYPSKNLGAYGDGGALFTNDDKLAEKIRMIANHGQKIRYYHDEIGVNSRLDAIQAAILRVKLRYLDGYSEARRSVAAFYDEALKGIPALRIPARNPQSTHVFHQYTLRVVDGRRDELAAFLKERGIPTMIYYPLPLHKQKAYSSDEYKEGAFPISELLCREVISLPIHTEMNEAQLGFISQAVKDFFIK